MVKLVGILNVTPDSFFDGGKYNIVDNALKQLEILIKEGTEVIDVGAESTRPGAMPISSAEEYLRLQNILPEVVRYIKNYNQKNSRSIEISLDSRHHHNIKWGLEIGIDIINDVSGGTDLEIIKLAANSAKNIVVMHNLGLPAAKDKIIDPDLDVVKELIVWMEDKLEQLEKFGVKKSQIIFDPGIGFGKNAAQSIEILKEIQRFRILDLPLFIGHSNKSFLDKISWDNQYKENNRHNKTLAVSSYLAKHHVEYIRVHNIAENKLAIGDKIIIFEPCWLTKTSPKLVGICNADPTFE